MTVFAVSAPIDREDALAEAAVRHGHRVALRAADAVELAAGVSRVAVDAVLVAPDPRFLDVDLVRACDRLGIRVIAVVDDRAGESFARARGVDAVRFADGFPAIEWAMTNARGAAVERPGASRGSVLAVWGPAGSPGRTTIAIALAAELAALGQRTALADVDTHAASIAPALGLLDESPGFAAAARLVRTSSLTVSELERLAQVVDTQRGPLHVLTGIARTSRWPELGAERVAGVLECCRDWAEWTVVDTAAPLETDEEITSDTFAPRRNAATLAALREADMVLAVGSGDPVGMTRFLHGFRDLIDVVPADRITVVMNKVRASAMGLAPEAGIKQTLQRFGGIECNQLWPFDAAATDAAVLAGKPLGDVAGRSRLRRRVHAFARSLVPEPQAAPAANPAEAAPATRRERRMARPRGALLRNTLGR